MQNSLQTRLQGKRIDDYQLFTGPI